MIKCNKNVFETSIKNFWRALQENKAKQQQKKTTKNQHNVVLMPVKVKTHLLIFFFATEKKFLVLQGASAEDNVSQGAKYSARLVPK